MQMYGFYGWNELLGLASNTLKDNTVDKHLTVIVGHVLNMFY